MPTSARLFAIFGLVLSMLGATALTASAAETFFEVLVIDCATDDPNVEPGQVDWRFGEFAADEVDCVTSTFAPDGTEIALYAAGDLETALDSEVIGNGEGSGSLVYDFEGDLSFQVGADGAVSGPFTATGGTDVFVVAIRYQVAPATEGDIEVLKFECVDDQLAGTVVFDIQAAIETSECGPGNGYLIGLLDGNNDPVVDPQPTVDGFVAFDGLVEGTYRLTENGEISDDITVIANESVIVNVINYVASEPEDGTLQLANYSCVGEPAGTTIFVTPPGESLLRGVETLECVLGPELLYIYPFGDLEADPILLTVEVDGNASIELPAGTHLIVEPDSGAAEDLTIASGLTTSALVETVVAPPPTTGSVLISAYNCIGVEAGVEIEVSEPTFAADDVDLTECAPLNALSFSIYPFGDTESDPITGTTDADANGDGVVLLDGIPSTEGDAAAHLFRTVVFDSDFEANFDVVVGGVTAITVIVFEPPAPTATEPAAPTATQPTAPTATATATTPADDDDDDGAAPTATGTVSTLPSTGAGDEIGAAGDAAWLLIGALGLIAIASAGFALRRRVA